MMEQERLLELERGFWFEGAEYYREHLAEQSTFVFPGMILEKEAAIEEVEQAPRWGELDVSETQFIRFSAATVLLTYRAEAHLEGDDTPVRASVTSIYRTDDDPKLLFHQQTPDPP